MTAPDPRGPDELEAGRKLEAVWAANARRLELAARAEATAAFWAAVETNPPNGETKPAPAETIGADCETVTPITAARRAPRA